MSLKIFDNVYSFPSFGWPFRCILSKKFLIRSTKFQFLVHDIVNARRTKRSKMPFKICCHCRKTLFDQWASRLNSREKTMQTSSRCRCILILYLIFFTLLELSANGNDICRYLLGIVHVSMTFLKNAISRYTKNLIEMKVFWIICVRFTFIEKIYSSWMLLLLQLNGGDHVTPKNNQAANIMNYLRKKRLQTTLLYQY